MYCASILIIHLSKGPFTNYVYKRRGVGGQKNRPFVNFYTIEYVNGGVVGGQKKPNLVNVVCERPLMLGISFFLAKSEFMCHSRIKTLVKKWIWDEVPSY